MGLQSLIGGSNLTQFRIEVFQGDLLLQDLEEARKGRFGNPQLFGETLKLVGGDALGESKMNVAPSLEAVGV